MSLKELQLQQKPVSKIFEPCNGTILSTVKATQITSQKKNDNNNDDSYDDDDDIRSANHQSINKLSNRPKTTNGPVNSKSTPSGFSEKDITPKERMIMNKLKKADEEAIKIGKMAKENYEERMLRQTFRREATIHSSVSIIEKYIRLKISLFESIFKIKNWNVPQFDQEKYIYHNQFNQTYSKN